MEAQATLLEQIDKILTEVDLTKRAMEAQADQVAPYLRERTGVELIVELDKQRGKVIQDRGNAAAAGPGRVLSVIWINFERHRESCNAAIRECLKYLQGARNRGSSLREEELCRAADELIDFLCKALPDIQWKRFCIVSDAESFSDDTQFIRLKFPLPDLWDVPVAAHEFGHFLSSRLRERDRGGAVVLPFQALLEERCGKKRNELWFDLNELFADVCATFALGSAYAYTCLLTRFSSASPWQRVDSAHPPDAVRARAILNTLGRMDRETDGDRFGPRIEWLAETWGENRTSAGENAPPGLKEDELDADCDKIYDLLVRCAGQLRYRSIQSATALADRLERGEVVPGLSPNPDLFNAMWRLRLTPGTTPGKINASVVEALRRGRTMRVTV